ncbi:cyclic nucleotide-binding domain-containing protein [Sphingobacterium cavernae]|uniref:Crp/Fnr family transcriptional regulator n=1 Tax=Sphingobacterium cavernae TaxID=2592657 RepID=UPI00122FC666|nr:Crp/Fnr family transcriptional regulator [Sphingobacterium cavernae]
MNRTIAFINKYTDLSEQAIDFLYTYGRIQKYRKGEIFVLQQESNKRSCLLLTGLVGFSIINDKNDSVLTRIITPMNYFVGCKHIYSNKGALANIEFLKDSEAFVLNNLHLLQAIRNFPEFSLIYNILKQKDLVTCNHYIHLNKIKHIDRLTYFYSHFPELKEQLTVRQLCILLGFSNSKQYYFALEKYYKSQGF